jgi:antitoxin ParD1/3/4
MPTRNINLTKHFDDFVDKSVATGDYQNASEVVRDALRLLQLKRQEDRLKLARLREAVDAGVRSIERGDYVTVAPGATDAWLAKLGRPKARKARRRA